MSICFIVTNYWYMLAEPGQFVFNTFNSVRPSFFRLILFSFCFLLRCFWLKWVRKYCVPPSGTKCKTFVSESGTCCMLQCWHFSFLLPVSALNSCQTRESEWQFEQLKLNLNCFTAFSGLGFRVRNCRPKKKVWEEKADVRALSFYGVIRPLSTRLMKSNFLFFSLADSWLQFFFLLANFSVCL